MAHVVYKKAHACKSGCGHDHGPKTDHDDHLPIIKDPFGEVDARNLESQSKLLRVSYVCLFFMIVEAVGGYYSNSIAIMSDAAHLLSDLLSFFVGIAALRLATKGAKSYLPFGYHRAEVLGAMISILIVWVLTVVLLIEAFDRFINPPKQFNPMVMMGTAALGILVNIIMGLTLHQGTHKHFHVHLDGTKCSGNHDHQHSDSHDHHEEHQHSHKCSHGHDHKEHGAHPGEKKGVEMTHLDHDHEHCNGHHDDDTKISEEGHSLCEDEGAQEPLRKYSDDGFLVSTHDHGVSHKMSVPDPVIKSNLKPQRHKNSHGSHSHHGHNSHAHHEDESHFQSALSKVIGQKSDHNLNVRAAYAHIIGDLIQSIGVFFIAVVIYCYPNWVLFDPLCTVAFSIIVVFTTVPVAKDCIYILMEGSDPEQQAKLTQKVTTGLEELAGVTKVENLKIWTICEGKMSLQVTLQSKEQQTSNLITKAKAVCLQHGIQSSSIEVDNHSAFIDVHPQKEGCDHSHEGKTKFTPTHMDIRNMDTLTITGLRTHQRLVYPNQAQYHRISHMLTSTSTRLISSTATISTRPPRNRIP